jgi:hypothetical protein
MKGLPASDSYPSLGTIELVTNCDILVDRPICCLNAVFQQIAAFYACLTENALLKFFINEYIGCLHEITDEANMLT